MDAIAWRPDSAWPTRAAAGSNTRWPRAAKGLAQTLDTEPLAVRAQVRGPRAGSGALAARGGGRLSGGHRYAGGRGCDSRREPAPGIATLRGGRLHALQALQTATLNPALLFDRLQDFGTVRGRPGCRPGAT
ncbi:MAG: hypothetical protein WKG07_35155 [Hymenobacter sp.]